MMQYKMELDAILREREIDLDTLGEKIRREVITPFCRKYELTFTSGMGTFFFTSVKDDASYNDPISPDWPTGKQGAEMRVIFSLLNQEIGRSEYLGFYVGDVSK